MENYEVEGFKNTLGYAAELLRDIANQDLLNSPELRTEIKAYAERLDFIAQHSKVTLVQQDGLPALNESQQACS